MDKTMNNILKNFLITLITLALAIFASPALADNTQQFGLMSAERHSIQTLINRQDDTQHITTLYRDLDEDGVPDRQDHCLNSALGFPVNALGCELDKDRDEVFDRNDQCPNTPLGKEVNFLGCEGDQDKDKVLDSKDECPNTPLGMKVNNVGCQKVIANDDDRDGVINALDLCPETPLGAIVNDRGCQPKVFIIANIVFNTGSYAVRSNQRDILNNAAARLKDKVADEVIVITGFTDSVGTDARNLQLSWNRAQSVKEYFVRNYNYSAERVFVLGQGELNPVSSNDTSEGRQNNRRITFEVIAKDKIHPDAQQNMPEEMKGYDPLGYRN